MHACLSLPQPTPSLTPHSYDFGPWPLLEGVHQLPPHVLRALTGTRAVCLNGFVFDELPLALVKSAVEVASAAGAAIFFDPGACVCVCVCVCVYACVRACVCV